MAKGKSPAVYSKLYHRLIRRKRRTALDEITGEQLNNNNLDSNLTHQPSSSSTPLVEHITGSQMLEEIRKEGISLDESSSLMPNSELEFSSEMMDPGSPLPPLNIELQTQDADEPVVIGRRLVDVDYFLHQLGEISDHCPTFRCNLQCLQIASEFRRGLDSKLSLKCSMCAQLFDVRLIEKKKNSMDVNHQMVAGVMSSGIGHSHLQTITASVDLPGLTVPSYTKFHNTICELWETAAANSMAQAVKEEIEYAISIGSVDRNGTPLIAVATDGCWSKRSYGKNYSALSGAAVIIGLKFKKVLYLGVKNKYCIVCARAANNESPPEHKCFKNYTGPSTAMESTILVEGFKRSLSDYGVIYHKFVADGDSSTYKKILDARPYGDMTVEKIECKNHLLRNFCNALVKLSQDTQFPPEMRKFLKERYLRLRTGVTCAIKYWGSKKLSLAEKIENLSKDILNGPRHVFGDHENCQKYFCSPEKRRPEPIGLMAQLDASGLLQALEKICRKLSYHSRSLIHNVTSNIAESYNSLVAKYVGGKRVNYSLKRSYAGRCHAAVVSFNTGTLHTTTHVVNFGTDPNTNISQLERRRRRPTQVKKPKNSKWRKKPTVPVSKDPHYGINAQQPDMSPDVFKDAKTAFLKDLKLSSAEREELERSTVSQRNSAEWLGRRRKLLTSFLFGEVCLKRDSTSCTELVTKQMYGKSLSYVPAVRFGIDNEETAIKQLELQENITIENCGLFVDQEYAFLGTTPDGKYADGIVEIKCPKSVHEFPLEDAMKKHDLWKWDPSSNSYIINKNHHWYYQIQGQLHITKAAVCMFGIWFGVNSPMKVYKIQRDDEFWKTKMEAKLVRFFYDCMLPELVDPRVPRSMPLRDPPYVLKAMDELKVRKERKEEMKRIRQEKLEKKENTDEKKVSKKRKMK